MVHTFAGRGSKHYRYYTCVKAIKSGWSTCPTKSLPAAEIETAVVDQIRCIAQDVDLQQEVLFQASSAADTDLGELATQQRQLERQLSRDHAEISRLAVAPDPSSATTARIATVRDTCVFAASEFRPSQWHNQCTEAHRGRQRLSSPSVTPSSHSPLAFPARRSHPPGPPW